MIDDFYKHIKSVNKYIIGAVIQSEAGLKLIRKEIRNITPGIKVEEKEIESILVGEVLKRENQNNQTRKLVRITLMVFYMQ